MQVYEENRAFDASFRDKTLFFACIGLVQHNSVFQEE
jgi:hypothetical protein